MGISNTYQQKNLLLLTSNSLYWLPGTLVERRSVPGELSVSYARPAADG